MSLFRRPFKVRAGVSVPDTQLFHTTRDCFRTQRPEIHGTLTTVAGITLLLYSGGYGIRPVGYPL